MAVRGAGAGFPLGRIGMTRALGIQPSAQTLTPAWTSPTSNTTMRPNNDYSKIMGNYDSIYNTARNFQPISHTQIPQYSQTGRLNEVANQLSDMSKTGGYSEGDISSFRQRGLSPIRSIYAGALQNLKRQKVLQGGYSPNYGAVAAKMAREQSGIISDKTSKLNADIAEKVAEGKRFGISNLAPIAERESQLTYESKRDNAAGRNRVNEFNATNRQNSIAQQLAAASGMTNLYGTTPAQTQNFSNQVMSNVGVSGPSSTLPYDTLNSQLLGGYRRR